MTWIIQIIAEVLGSRERIVVKNTWWLNKLKVVIARKKFKEWQHTKNVDLQLVYNEAKRDAIRIKSKAKTSVRICIAG